MPAPAVTIRDAVVAAIQAAGVSGLPSASVKHRKVAVRYETDPDPLCLVVLGGDRQVGRTNMTVSRLYPVTVLTIRKGALLAARSDGWMEEARATLYGKLHRQLLLGLSGIVRACEYDSDPPFDRRKFDENDEVSAQLFSYLTEETAPDAA